MNLIKKFKETNFNNVAKKIIFLFFLFLIFFTFTNNSLGQEEENNYNIILNWEAYNFYPNFYLNKIFPIFNSNIRAGIVVLKNNKIIDLEKYLIQWYIDDTLIAEDYGLTNIIFKIKKNAGNFYILKVKITDEKNEKIEKNIAINIYQPIISLEYFKENNDLILKSWPFFFNIEKINDLEFNWTINKQKFNFSGDNELIIKNYKNLNLNEISVLSSITNNKNPFESTVIKKNIKINE